jgi:flagellum-specific peptidoglycan hydrolase FlgJ
MHTADARAVAARTGIPVEVILAQSALESDWGRSVKGNAYFGIKGKSPTGNSTTFATHEYTLSRQRIGKTDQFRAYSDYAESAEDYASLIRRRYSGALAHGNDPAAFADHVASHRYASDPDYGAKLKSIIHSHVTPVLSK